MKLKNMKKIDLKLTKNEETASLAIAKVIVILGAVPTYLLKLLLVIIWRLKKQIYKLTIVAIAVTVFMSVQSINVYAPKARAELNGYTYTDKPVTEHQEIINNIYDVFGKDSDKAFKLLKGNGVCSGENGSLNPNARNWNSDGSVDYSVFQINDRWQGVSNPAFLFDPKINIDMAYNIYKRSGNTFKMWTGGKCQGI